MTYEFETAEQARTVIDSLRRRYLRLPHNSDTYRLIQNLDKLITDLSKMEVAARSVRNIRNHSVRIAAERQKQVIVDAIKRIDQLMLIQQLMA